MITKQCTICKIEKNISDFRPRPDRKSGIYPSCKKCKSTQQQERYKKNKNHFN